jgi:hypothetical protein
MKGSWSAVWPWLVVVAILGLAKVPALYLHPEAPDAIVIFEDGASAWAAAPIGR